MTGATRRRRPTGCARRSRSGAGRRSPTWRLRPSPRPRSRGSRRRASRRWRRGSTPSLAPRAARELRPELDALTADPLASACPPAHARPLPQRAPDPTRWRLRRVTPDAREELGVEPGPTCARLHDAVLRPGCRARPAGSPRCRRSSTPAAAAARRARRAGAGCATSSRTPGRGAPGRRGDWALRDGQDAARGRARRRAAHGRSGLVRSVARGRRRRRR